MATTPVVQGSFSFLLNGRAVSVRGVDPQTTLLDYLRGNGLTGAKESCAEGECGACAVAMVQNNSDGSCYKAVNSCLMYLPMAAGQEIYTVEALAQSGGLHPVQRAIADAGGSQCGYCTPGFVMSLFAEYYRPGRAGVCEPEALEGNLCRCTGYRPIRDAALSLGAAELGSFGQRLSAPAPRLAEMVYARNGVRFSRPASLAACVAILAQQPGARLVAGGTDLAVESNLLGRAFPDLVSVEAVPELKVFHDTPDVVELGAGLTLEEIATRWEGAPPVFQDWLRLFASPLIRNRATLGGNLATASPIGDSAPLLLALDAQVKIANADGERTVPLEAFFVAYRQTALTPRDVLVSIVIPKPLPDWLRFFKVAKRRVDDISTVAAGIAVTLDRMGRVAAARFAYGGVASTPVRATEAEAEAIGRPWNPDTIRSVQAALSRTLKPISDHRGSAAYRLAMAQTVLERVAS